ncbi:MAG: hypothetical protein PHC85_01110 [Candidatus Pacebacteria bacterium]|nr:hypothetical protein [Candidatus Paceibacterota bacterium]
MKKSFYRGVNQAFSVFFFLMAAMGCGLFGLFFLSLLRDTSPVITIFSVLVFTAVSFCRWEASIFVFLGFFLYGACWFAIEPWGLFVAQAVWGLGIFTWFKGVCMSFGPRIATDGSFKICNAVI